jgi:hypothetical protein
MIFYGSKATHLTSDILYDVTCPHCGTKGETQGAVYARYAHIYWIPLFPMSKKATSECKHCLRTYVEGADVPTLQPAYDELKSRVKTPIWHWAGSALIGFGVIMSMISGNENATKRQQLVGQPQVGDVYHVKMTDGNYTTMKVKAINGDSVSMFLNDMSVNKLSGISKLEDATHYNDFSTENYAKTQLKTMLAKNEIVEIKR